MSSASEPPANHRNPPWLAGRGMGPRLRWSIGTDDHLTCLARSRETHDLFAADKAGAIYRIDRHGKISQLTRISSQIVRLAWCDDGSQGVIIAGEDEVLRLDHSLKTIHKLSLPDVCLGVAISPFGHHIAVSMASGLTVIYNDRSKKIAQFQTMRPLSFLTFCHTEPLLFGAAEHGLICCYNLAGAEIWQDRNWANVGALAITGEGDLVYTASFAHGVQALDGDGTFVGSYILDGTVNKLDVSFEPERLIVSTVERSLFWLDDDGDQLWTTEVNDLIVDVLCDPLGEFAIVGLQEKGIFCIDWEAKTGAPHS
jgi:hypothetical protein